MPKILIKSQKSQTPVDLPENEPIEVGREPVRTPNLIIKDTFISRRHATIEFRNGDLYITDLGSLNGTWVEGRRLEANRPERVQHSVVLGSGNTSLELETYDFAGYNPSPAHSTGQNEGKNVEKNLSDLLEYKSELIFGRSIDCDITLEDSHVSRRHTKVYKENNTIWVEDLNSTNGTYINGERIQSKTKLSETDVLYIGLFTFSLGETSTDLRLESAISAQWISKRFKNGNFGLQPMSINIPPGEMVALMGPSGCGKSTLLKILNGYHSASSGQVCLLGLPIASNYFYLKQHIGYVPQDDIVHPELTVDDTLYYAAKIRLGPHSSDREIAEKMTAVLTALNINDPIIRRNQVGSLSGGQRKRISIAVELINNPRILFLDEPTSPLDPETIEEFLKCLRNLCSNGTTVIMVTHKPEDLNFVDRLIFLGTKGFHVYDGKIDKFLPHFRKKQLVEVYSILNSEETTVLWHNLWYHEQPLYDFTLAEEKPHTQPKNHIWQLSWLTRRYAHIKRTDHQNVIMLLAQPLLVAIMILVAFKDFITTTETGTEIGNWGAISMMSVATVWFGVSNSVKEIVGEKAIFRRERMFNLSLGPYLLSKWIVLSTISMVQLLLFVSILKIGYGPDFISVFSTFTYLMVVSTASTLFGLTLSAASKSTEQVMTILPVAMLPQIILSGMVSEIKSKWHEVLSYLSMGRWGTEGIARIQNNFESVNSNKPFEPLLKKFLYKPDHELLKIFDSFPSNLNALILLSAISLGTILYLLIRTEKKQA